MESKSKWVIERLCMAATFQPWPVTPIYRNQSFVTCLNAGPQSTIITHGHIPLIGMDQRMNLDQINMVGLQSLQGAVNGRARGGIAAVTPFWSPERISGGDASSTAQYATQRHHKRLRCRCD